MTLARLLQVGLAAAFLALAVLLTAIAPREALAASLPTIDSVSPTQGPVTGGTTVTIRGADFQPGVLVYIGSSPAPAVVRVSSTEITLTTPTGSVGGANVTIQNPDGGAVQRNSGFFYHAFEPPLTIGSLSVDRGSVSGGTAITVVGNGFHTAASVFVGNVPANAVNVVGSSSILLRAPANVPGPASITVINPNGAQATLPNAFTYEGAVTVTSFAPGGGPVAGGTTVTITGNAFIPGAKVAFNGVPATATTVVNSTQIVAVTPPATGPSGRTVTVTNPDGTTASAPSTFTYGPASGAVAPTLTTVSPSTGSAAGGGQVSLTGSGFVGGIAVFFGGVPSPLVSWNGASSVFARVPANVSGPVAVTVVNNDGTFATLANGYTYDAGLGFALVSAVPLSTTPGAGTIVSVAGGGINAGSWVTFNDVPAVSSTVVGSAQIVGVIPAGVTGPVKVSVTQVGGLSASLSNAFTVTGSAATPAPPATTPPATTPPTTTPPATTPPAGGTGVILGTPVFSASGQALAIFGGGTADQLETAAAGAKATGAWVQDSTGAYRLLVVGGPAFLKDQFKAQFPAGISANTAATLTR